MKIKNHNLGEIRVAEIISDEVILRNVDNGLDLLGNLNYQGYNHIFIYKKNITTDFFDLKTKLAGDILQKFVQYQMPLTIIGDLKEYDSKSLNDFISESNKGNHVNFMSSIDEALMNLKTKRG